MGLRVEELERRLAEERGYGESREREMGELVGKYEELGRECEQLATWNK